MGRSTHCQGPDQSNVATDALALSSWLKFNPALACQQPLNDRLLIQSMQAVPIPLLIETNILEHSEGIKGFLSTIVCALVLYLCS